MTEPETLTIERLKQILAKPPATALWFTIPPETMRYVIDKLNTRNRPRRPGHIASMAKAMRNGDWKANAETIKFSDRKRLLDGQHRMYAGLKAEVPFVALVAFNIDEATFQTIDVPKVRDGGDSLAMLGSHHPSEMATAIRWLVRIEGRMPKAPPSISVREMGELYLDKYKQAEDFVTDARKVAKANGMSPGMVTAVLFKCHQRDPVLYPEFVDALTGNASERFWGVRTMQAEQLAMKNRGQRGGNLTFTVRAAMLINAWNSGRRNKRVGVAIKWNWENPFPVIL